MEIKEANAADIPGIVLLYKDAGWLNYTNNPAMLHSALRQSLRLLIAVEDGSIVGMIRAVGDEASILYIQDIIVRQQYRRRGIGTQLLQAMIELYPQVYQTVLLTDDRPESRAFYEKCGFTNAVECACTAMIKRNI